MLPITLYDRSEKCCNRCHDVPNAAPLHTVLTIKYACNAISPTLPNSPYAATLAFHRPSCACHQTEQRDRYIFLSSRSTMSRMQLSSRDLLAGVAYLTKFSTHSIPRRSLHLCLSDVNGGRYTNTYNG